MSFLDFFKRKKDKATGAAIPEGNVVGKDKVTYTPEKKAAAEKNKPYYEKNTLADARKRKARKKRRKAQRIARRITRRHQK